MRCIKEVLQKNKVTVSVYLAIGIVNSFMADYRADYFRKVVDGLSGDTLMLSGILGYGLILAVNYCMNYAEEYPAKKLEYGIFLDFRLMALQKVSTIDYLEYQKTGTGKLMQQIENGAEAGRDVLYGFWFCLIRQLLPTIGFSIYFIWKINREVTCVLLAGYGIIFVITNVLLRSLYQIKEKILDNEEQLNHYLVRGFMEMLVFRMERQFPAEICKATGAKQEIVDYKVRMNMIHEAFFTIFALLVTVLDAGILVYAWSSRSLTVGSVVALISLIENAYTPIAIFNVLYVQYKLDRVAFARFEEFLQRKDDEHLHHGKALEGSAGEIHVNHLSFQYEGRKIFNDLSLSVKNGEKVAFVGESGSGKSTLVKLMLGLLKYDEGQITVGGTNLEEACLSEMYGKISYLSQDSPVFDGTIKENLVFDRDVPGERLMEALDRVQLSHLIRLSGRGLDTKIGEKGACLSGGEKQRLALARLWLQKPELVILDEAASAMDSLTEEAVMGEVIRRLEGQTVIAVTHHLSSVIGFDRIVVFYEGKIVGQGSFEELMNTNPYFTELYRARLL